MNMTSQGPVLHEVREVLADGGCLVRRRLDALSRRGERDEEEDHGQRREDADGELVAPRVVALAEVVHHRQREALDDELRDHRAHEPVRR
jgi:hypothetical protein